MTVEMRLDAHPRTETGRGAMRRLRHSRQVPGVIYGAGKAPQPVAFDNDQFYRLLEEDGFFSTVLTVKVGSKNEQAIIKDIQRHPFKQLVQHVDLQRVRANVAITVHVPVQVVGEDKAPGIKKGGVLHHDMLDVELTCLPKNLPPHITVDVSGLNVGQAIHLSELELPKGVTVAPLQQGSDHDAPVISIQATRKSRGAGAAEEGEGGEAAE